MTIFSRPCWFSFIAVLMALVMLNLSVVALAQEAEMAEARAAAEADAQADVNGTLWFFVGCIGGWLGVAGAYLIKPSPPASRLIGKSPEYIAFYTDAYQAKAKSIQTGKAWTGCLVSAVAYVAYVVVLTVAAAESTTY